MFLPYITRNFRLHRGATTNRTQQHDAAHFICKSSPNFAYYLKGRMHI